MKKEYEPLVLSAISQSKPIGKCLTLHIGETKDGQPNTWLHLTPAFQLMTKAGFVMDGLMAGHFRDEVFQDLLDPKKKPADIFLRNLRKWFRCDWF